MNWKKIAQFAPDHVEAGVGLALEDGTGRYLFYLAGSRHSCPPGELFYAGIGGHREKGEDWLECAHREAREELGTDVGILPATCTWYIPHKGAIRRLELDEQPRPLALYEMLHPSGTPRAGNLYRIVIYRASLHGDPKYLPPDEVRSVIALKPEQVMQGIKRKFTLQELLDEGASIVASNGTINPKTRLYPIGTAMALGRLLRHLSALQGQDLSDPCIRDLTNAIHDG